MKTILILLALGIQPLFGQTTLIAHKSHSGTAATFALADPGNFGIPPSRLVKITKLSDTSVVLTNSRGGMMEEKDTLYNHPVYSDPAITVDSMRNYARVTEYSSKELEFENFDKKQEKSTKVKEETEKMEKQSEKPFGKTKPAKEKKKKKSSLLLFWIIGGGTFTGILLLSRKPQRSAKYA